MSLDFVVELYKQPQTVFTAKDIAMLFPALSTDSRKNRIHYAVKTGKLLSPRRGFYTKDNIEPFELANKLYTPSYISLETVLEKVGIIFQHYETIFLASYLTRTISVSGLKLFYRKIKDDALFNPLGLKREKSYTIASPERALLDAIFLYKDYHFDNLNPLDWEMVKKLIPIYKSKQLATRAREYEKQAKEA